MQRYENGCLVTPRKLRFRGFQDRAYTTAKPQVSILGCFKNIGIQIDPQTIDIDGARLATMKHIISEVSVVLTRDVAATDVIYSQSTRNLIESSRRSNLLAAGHEDSLVRNSCRQSVLGDGDWLSVRMSQKKTAIKSNCINVLNLKKAAFARLDRITATQCFNRNLAKRGHYTCTSTKTRK